MQITDAELISILMMQINAKLNDSVAFVRDKGSEADFLQYRSKVASTMGCVVDILNDLYAQHPTLKPEQLGGTYKIDPGIHKDRFYLWS